MNLEQLRKSLLDYDYLQSKLNATDTETLIAESRHLSCLFRQSLFASHKEAH
jgi:hypothetical protein